MKETAGIVITLVIGFLALAGCVSAPADQAPATLSPVTQEAQPHYIIGVDGDYPPFTYHDSSGNLTGFDIEAARWIAERQGFEAKFVEVPWDGIIPALKSGSIDMIYSGLTVSRERERDVNFTRPYYTVNQSVAIRRGTGIIMQDLYSGRLRIGAQAGSSGEAWVEENLQRKGTMRAEALVLFPDLQTLTEGLVNETIDASVFDAPPQELAIAGRSLTIIGEIPTEEHYAVAVRKTDPQLMAIMDDGLEKLMQDPYWQQLLQKYSLAWDSRSP
jgi:polar amino acid transport system substrate-binding protein